MVLFEAHLQGTPSRHSVSLEALRLVTYRRTGRPLVATASILLMAVINFTPLYGALSDLAACCYLLEIDDVSILLDCGWNDAYDIGG
jgi:hypothetical protein